MTPTRDEHSLVGAYATDALSDGERRQFERHLAECPDCADELRGFRETTARLASAVPAVPRDEMKRATLAAAARTRQLPPVPATVPALSRVARVMRTARARFAPGVLAATAVLAVLVGLLTNSGQTARHRLDAAQQNEALVQMVLSAPDATLLSAPVATGGTAHVVMSASQHALVFSAAALRPLEGSKSYELWLIRGGRDEPGGTLPALRRGSAGPVPMVGIQPGDVLGISVEPGHGSHSPTTPMIAELAL